MGVHTVSQPQRVNSLAMSDPFPEIKSAHSLVAKYVTKPIWEKLSRAVTKTSGFTLAQAIACAVEFDNQHCGIYPDAVHTSDMDVNKIKGDINPAAPVHSCRIRVGRSIDGFGLSPGITKEQRLGVESLMVKAFANLKGDLAGTYYPLTGMDEKVRQQLVDDHFLFVSGDPNLKVQEWRETGLRDVESSTTRTKPSSPGSMRKISLESSPCKRVAMSDESSIDSHVVSRLLGTLSRPSFGRTSCWTPSMDTCTRVPPTWGLV